MNVSPEHDSQVKATRSDYVAVVPRIKCSRVLFDRDVNTPI